MWVVRVEYERADEDGTPRMTGGVQRASDELVEQANIGGAALIGMIAEQVYEDVREALEP